MNRIARYFGFKVIGGRGRLQKKDDQPKNRDLQLLVITEAGEVIGNGTCGRKTEVPTKVKQLFKQFTEASMVSVRWANHKTSVFHKT